MADNLPILKRKRATLRSNITRCATAIHDSAEATTLDDLEYYRNPPTRDVRPAYKLR